MGGGGVHADLLYMSDYLSYYTDDHQSLTNHTTTGHVHPQQKLWNLSCSIVTITLLFYQLMERKNSVLAYFIAPIVCFDDKLKF